MLRLTYFELRKLWGRRGLGLVVGVLLLNLFSLWYTGRGSELSAYRLFAAQTAGMSEAEKGAFIKELKQTIDGVAFVEQILSMQKSQLGAGFAAQELEANPGVFEAYYELYESEAYLRYTDSLEAELAFLRELEEEERKVAGYGEYLQKVQERRDTLSGISVFASQEGESFALRNIQKSAEDYSALSAEGVRWMPSKAVVSAMEHIWTDLFLISLTFLFVGILITEEKQKGLLVVTRCTRRGVLFQMLAKLLALLLSCLILSGVFYGSNYVYFGLVCGWSDLGARVQSLAPYMESGLSVNLLEFLGLIVGTKAAVLFCFGAVLAGFCILSESMLLPYLAGGLLWAAGWALYRFVPATSPLGAVKYLHFVGIFRAQTLYGGYLNLNLWGRPFSRIGASWLLLSLGSLGGAALDCLLFARGQSWRLKQRVKRLFRSFHPHASLFRYEAYKILVSEHGLLLLVVFGFLIGYGNLDREEVPSVQEQYYQELMLQLEGELTEAKEELLAAENQRYQEAFAEIENIERLVDSGVLDGETAKAMKARWYRVTAFYPEFQRAWRQLENAGAGGRFLYDTGYLYWFGVLGDGVLTEFLLFTMGLIFAFSHAFSVEEQSGMRGILKATAKGSRGIGLHKGAVCGLTAAAFSLLPSVSSWVGINAVFPLHGLFFPANSIPFYQDVPRFVPVLALVLLKVFLQTAVGCFLTLVVLGLSAWRKNHVQTIFFGFLFLCLPLILAELGFESAGRLSLYPLYAWTLQTR